MQCKEVKNVNRKKLLLILHENLANLNPLKCVVAGGKVVCLKIAPNFALKNHFARVY